MAAKVYYYMDHTALLAEDFYLVAEELAAKEDVTLLLDASIYARIEDYKRLSRTADALALESFVNLFATLGNALEVDTNEGLIAEPNFALEMKGCHLTPPKVAI